MFTLTFIVLLGLCHQGTCLTMKNGPRDAVLHREFVIKPDLIFLETGSAVLNPDYISVLRPFNFTNLQNLGARLDRLINTHGEICDQMAKNSIHSNRFIKARSRPRFRPQAIRICDKLGMKLPEVRNRSDAQALAQAMADHKDTQCHSGSYFEQFYADFLHQDATRARNPSITICNQSAALYKSDEHYGTPYYGFKIDRHRPHRYRINEAHNVDLCFGDFLPLPVYCQISDTFQQQMKQQISICKQHNQDMKRAKDSLHSSLQLLVQSLRIPSKRTDLFADVNRTVSAKVSGSVVRPKREATTTPSAPVGHEASHAAKHKAVSSMPKLPSAPLLSPRDAFTTSLENLTMYPLMRQPRGAFLFIVSAVSLVASIMTLMASSATPTQVEHTYQPLKVDTTGVDIEVANLGRDVHMSLSTIQTVTYQAQAELSAYNAYLRVLMSLQDNLLSFQATTQALTYGQVTSQIISPVDIAVIARQLQIGGNMRLSPNPSDYIVNPVSFNNMLAIQIDIPVLTKDKLVTLFEAKKYPIFKNKIKYELDCPFQHIAIYDHSDHFHMLSEQEYRNCLIPNAHCISRVPKTESSYGNCLSNEYFNVAPAVKQHLVAPDNSPFLYTYLNQTVFAVGEDTPLTFHCPKNIKAGPDHELLLQDRGVFHNPAFCTFQLFHMKFTPPRNLYRMQSTLNEQFSLPDVANVPELSDFEQLDAADVAIRLINLSNASHLSATKKWLIALSIISFLVLLHTLLSYFWFSYRTLPYMLYNRINSFFRRNSPPDPNISTQAQPTIHSPPPSPSILTLPLHSSTLNSTLKTESATKPLLPPKPPLRNLRHIRTLADVTTELDALSSNASSPSSPIRDFPRPSSPANTIVSLPATQLKTGFARASYKPASHNVTLVHPKQP